MNQKKISQEYEKAIQYIYELMKSGELTIGSRLPTERALAETLGIDSEMVKPNGMIYKADYINDDCIKDYY